MSECPGTKYISHACSVGMFDVCTACGFDQSEGGLVRDTFTNKASLRLAQPVVPGKNKAPALCPVAYVYPRHPHGPHKWFGTAQHWCNGVSSLHYIQCGMAVHVSRTPDGATLGVVSTGSNMDGWGWTCGFGWHTGLPTMDDALDALFRDPRFGLSGDIEANT